MAHCFYGNLFFNREKTLLSDDKHFTRLLRSDINVAGDDDDVVILAAKGLGKFQGTQYLKNISFTFA